MIAACTAMAKIIHDELHRRRWSDCNCRCVELLITSAAATEMSDLRFLERFHQSGGG